MRRSRRRGSSPACASAASGVSTPRWSTSKHVAAAEAAAAAAAAGGGGAYGGSELPRCAHSFHAPLLSPRWSTITSLPLTRSVAPGPRAKRVAPHGQKVHSTSLQLFASANGSGFLAITSSPASESRVIASPIVSSPLPAYGPHHSSKCAYASMARSCCHLCVRRKSSAPPGCDGSAPLAARKAVNGPQHFLRHGFGYSGLIAVTRSPAVHGHARGSK